MSIISQRQEPLECSDLRERSGENAVRFRQLSTVLQNKVTIITERYSGMLLAGIQNIALDTCLRGNDERGVGLTSLDTLLDILRYSLRHPKRRFALPR